MLKFFRGQVPNADVSKYEKPKYRQLTYAEVSQIPIATRLDIRDSAGECIGSLRIIDKPTAEGRKCLVTPGLESVEGAYAKVDLTWNVIKREKQGSPVILYTRHAENGSLVESREVKSITLVEGSALRDMDNPFALKIGTVGGYAKVEMGPVQITVDNQQEY